jgi:2-C-methyl-D-erythritol 2,4-cyclodiphosphate synthase
LFHGAGSGIFLGMTRTGIGYDTHCLVAGRPLILGGVAIAHETGLLGHSDADVLTHAVMDALLGAIADGDIGQHFPPSEPRWKDANSIGLLRHVVARLQAQGWQVGNVDVTVLAEAPRLAPHIAGMRACLASALQVEISAVSVKATTNEGLGAIGRREGISAMAVAAVIPRNAS